MSDIEFSNEEDMDENDLDEEEEEGDLAVNEKPLPPNEFKNGL